MKNIKRRILSFAMAFGLIVGVSSVPAHAEWKQSGVNWQYTNDDGTLKTGWLQDGANWYYLGTDNDMITGWMPFNGTWYYFNNDGTWDGSKTTTTMPDELQAAKSKLEQYSKENLSYYKTVTDGNSASYEFETENKIVYGTPSYFYTPSTGKSFVLTEGILVRLDVNQLINAKYTFDQCKNIADETLKGENSNSYSLSSDGAVNKWGEYYFTAYSTSDNQKIDAFYVSGYNGQIRR